MSETPPPSSGEQFFPPFRGETSDRVLNLLVNGAPPTFALRAILLASPRTNRAVGSLWDSIAADAPLPSNLFDPDRTPSTPLRVGDRVVSPNRQMRGTDKFGGYILARNDEWAFVLWDSPPPGAVTYDPVAWLQPP